MAAALVYGSSSLPVSHLLNLSYPVAPPIPRMKHGLFREEACPAHGLPACSCYPCSLRCLPLSSPAPSHQFLGPFPRTDSPWAGHRAPGVGNGQPGGLVSLHFSRELRVMQGPQGCAPAWPLHGSCPAGTVEASGAREHCGGRGSPRKRREHPQPARGEKVAETSPVELWSAQQPVIPP